MAEEGTNYTPLDRTKLYQQKKSFFLSNKALISFVVFLTIGVGMIGYYLVLQKPIRRQVPAYLSGEATACDIKLGPPISGSEKIEGNKYSIQVPLENKSNIKKRVKLSSGWFACSFNDQQTCSQGAIKEDKEFLLEPNEKKTIAASSEQTAGACGSLQIDLKIKAVKKADDDGKDAEGKDDDGTGWDESCNTNSTWVGGFYAFPQACGVVPTDTPTPTPTRAQPTETPTPTIVEPTNTPTPTLSQPTPTSTPEITVTTKVTPTVTVVDNSPTPRPTSGSTVSNPTSTSIPAQSANTLTPTEIVLVKATATPGQGVTTVAQVKEIPPAGVATFGKIFAIISTAVILLGLIL